MSSLLLRRLIVLAVMSCTGAALPALGTATPVKPLASIEIPEAVRALVRRSRLVMPPTRVVNWIGDRNEGSCVHASLVNLLHWQGRHQLADRWQATHGNGQSALGLAIDLKNAAVEYRSSQGGNEEFVAWACRTRRGAVVPFGPNHAVSLVGLDSKTATIMDPNKPDRPFQVDRAAFVADWKSRGGWAVTPLGTPAAPSPWLFSR